MELTKEQAKQEYNRRLRNNEFVTPEQLKGKNVYDVLQMPEYIANLQAIVNEQIETRTNTLSIVNEMKKKGQRVEANRHVIDRVFEMGLFTDMGDLVVDIAAVFNKQSKYKFVVRQYLHQLGKLAYDVTCESFILGVNPDMKELLDIATKTDEKPGDIRYRKNK